MLNFFFLLHIYIFFLCCMCHITPSFNRGNERDSEILYVINANVFVMYKYFYNKYFWNKSKVLFCILLTTI